MSSGGYSIGESIDSIAITGESSTSGVGKYRVDAFGRVKLLADEQVESDLHLWLGYRWVNTKII